MDTSQAFESNTGNNFVLLEKKQGVDKLTIKGLEGSYKFERYQFVETNRSQNNRIIKEQ